MLCVSSAGGSSCVIEHELQVVQDTTYKKESRLETRQLVIRVQFPSLEDVNFPLLSCITNNSQTHAETGSMEDQSPMKSSVLWGVTPYSPVEVRPRRYDSQQSSP